MGTQTLKYPNQKKSDCTDHKINFLLIDDDEAAHMLHKIAIEDAGRDLKTVKSYYSVDTAISCLKEIILCGQNENWPEYIFLDINMPLKTGYDFIEEFSKLNSQYRIPKIYMVSSSENPKDIKKAEDIDLIHSFKTKFLDKEFIASL